MKQWLKHTYPNTFVLFVANGWPVFQQAPITMKKRFSCFCLFCFVFYEDNCLLINQVPIFNLIFTSAHDYIYL